MDLFCVKAREIVDKKAAGSSIETSNVVAKSAEDAIARVRKEKVGMTWDWRDDDDKKRISKITSIEVIEVTHIADIDFN